tara:strand:- start:7487 stop:8101 length:615 start_codon:yes stop_codon:yes gene_type:complete
MNRLGLTTLAVIAAIASPAVAQTPQDAPPPAQRRMIDYLVNAPHVQNWMTWGVTPAPTPQAAEGVTGGQAVRVAVARGGDPWSVGAIMTNPAAITTGDVILVAVWIRRSDSNAATSPTSLPLLMVESQTEPKTVIARSADVPLSDSWTLVYASGTAAADYAPGQTAIILHLGREAQTLELGPALLFDMGPDYDPARLPTNPTGS